MLGSARHPRNAILMSHKRSQSDPITSTIGIDAIILKTVRVPEEDLYDNVHNWCKSALATSASEATVDHSADPPRWGHSQRLSALEKLDLLASNVQSLKDKASSTNTKIVNMNTEIANLNTEINIMALSQCHIFQCEIDFFQHIDEIYLALRFAKIVMQYHLAIKRHIEVTLLRIEDFMRMGHDSMMRSSKIFTESNGLACTKLVRFLKCDNPQLAICSIPTCAGSH